MIEYKHLGGFDERRVSGAGSLGTNAPLIALVSMAKLVPSSDVFTNNMLFRDQLMVM